MKKLSILTALLLICSSAFADEYVRGYSKSDGTYVNGYTRSSPNSSYNDNYSVRGNTNPYTGEAGTKSPTYNDRTPSYNTKTYGDPGYSYGGSSRSSSGSRNPYGYYGN